jgi:phosphoribosylaminoimidazole-succinocarboxamide synthase
MAASPLSPAPPPGLNHPMPSLADLAPYAGFALTDAAIPELPNHYRGKVRENYDLPDGRRLIIATDRLSAFDIILTAVPLKGQVLTQLARFWFDSTGDLCPNHVLSYPDPNVLLCRQLRIMPVEVVVRDYLAGTTSTSILSMYQAGRREMYGHRFPDGLRPNQKLPAPILTPTSKAFDAGHDEELTPAQIVDGKLLTAAQWEEVSARALALFARGREIAAKRGLILVDTKYEFGFDPEGRIILADEIHTPDSSRYWFAASYPARFEAGEPPESFDKDFVRRWVVARCDPYREKVPPIPAEVNLEAAQRYIQAFETITGTAFPLPPPDQPVLERIRRNLAPFFQT